MKRPDILLVLVRCEVKARYSGFGGWELSAKGAVPVILLAVVAMALWVR